MASIASYVATSSGLHPLTGGRICEELTENKAAVGGKSRVVRVKGEDIASEVQSAAAASIALHVSLTILVLRCFLAKSA